MLVFPGFPKEILFDSNEEEEGEEITVKQPFEGKRKSVGKRQRKKNCC